MSTLCKLIALTLAPVLLVSPGIAAVGSWNGVAFTAWNGVAQTSWNGTGISCASGGGTMTLAGSQQTNNTLVITVTLSGAIASGHGVYVVAWAANGAPTTFTSIADTGTNTYTKRQNANDASNGNSLITATAPAATGLSIGNTVVVTVGTQTDWYVFVYDVSSFTGYDVGTGQQNASTTTHSTGATSAIAGTNDAAISAFANFGQTFTSTWTGDAALSPGTAAIGSRVLMLRWKTVTTGAQTGTATTAAGVVSAAVIDCLKF